MHLQYLAHHRADLPDRAAARLAALGQRLDFAHISLHVLANFVATSSGDQGRVDELALTSPAADRTRTGASCPDGGRPDLAVGTRGRLVVGNEFAAIDDQPRRWSQSAQGIAIIVTTAPFADGIAVTAFADPRIMRESRRIADN